MRRVAGIAAAALFLSAAAARGDGKDDYDPVVTHPPTGVRTIASEGATTLIASVPGRLLDWCEGGGAGGAGRRVLFLLAAPERPAELEGDEDPPFHHLYRFDPEAETLEAVDLELPSDLSALRTLDLDGDGVRELIGGTRDRLLQLPGSPSEGPPTELWRGAAIHFGAALPLDGPPRLALPEVGALRMLLPTPGGSLRAGGTLLLPVDATRHAFGLRRTSPPVAVLRQGGRLVVAAGPLAIGPRRLASRLHDDGVEIEAWSNLPTPSVVQRSWFTVIDDRPVLLVATNSADEVGPLERQTLHLFALRSDRTQQGSGPWWNRQVTSRRWQAVEPRVLDLDDDGDDDLVVLQTDGLGGGETVAEAFLNHGRRGFEAQPRRTRIDAAAQGWHLGDDFDGDGLADLVLLSDGALRIHPGEETRSRRLVARKPWRVIPGEELPRESGSVTVDDSGSPSRTASVPASGGRSPPISTATGNPRSSSPKTRNGASAVSGSSSSIGVADAQVVTLAPLTEQETRQMPATSTARFRPALFAFLKDLAANNDRDWFQANKDRYEDHLKDPALAFISDFGPRLAKISPHFNAIPKATGGSLFRIYRDTRFSKIKTPYKTHLGIQFRHKQAKDVHAPGFYLHVEPGGSFIGVGMWHPDSPSLKGIRARIDTDRRGWKRVRDNARFRDRFDFGGESLKRAPRDYDEDHPLIEDLKRKDFIASARFTQKEILSPDFLDNFEAHCKLAAPFIRWLCQAVDVPF